MTAAELPLQQRLVALLSARQLLLMYCLERSGTVCDKSVRSQTKFHTSALSDQPAVLARAAICSSVNPFAAPGAFARSKPGDEGAGSCSMFISPAAATAAAAAAILVRTANEMCKWEMAEPAELAAVPLENLPLRRWRHQRRRPQPKPALLRSCQAHCLKKSRQTTLSSCNAVPLKRSLMAAAAAAPAAAACKTNLNARSMSESCEHVAVPALVGTNQTLLLQPLPLPQQHSQLLVATLPSCLISLSLAVRLDWLPASTPSSIKCCQAS